MHLTLIRHAESTWNATGQWQGQSDVPLSPRGRLQVRALAQRMFGASFDGRYTSDLQRARETAEALGEPATADPRYREIDVGDWAGMRRPEVAEAFPDQVRALRAGEPVRIGGGESMEQFEARVDAAIDALRSSHGGERVLLVTHGGVVRALATRVLGVRDRQSPLVGVGNTAISSVVEEDGELLLEVYNDGRHLDAGDRESAMMKLAEPSARVAVVACDREAAVERSLVDAILSTLGIARYVAPPDTIDAPLASELLADPLPDGGIDALRAEHAGGSFALVLDRARVPGALGAMLRLTEDGAGGFATPRHGAVAQARLFDAGGGELCSYGVTLLDG